MATKRIPIARQEPGRRVGVIAAWKEGPYIATILWTVNRYRKDYGEVLKQQEKQEANGGKLVPYSESLFNSMFKNWG
ncbi:hypothetical protein ACF5W4_11240 [Bacillota bacterium Lsc_1132]